MGYLNKNKYIYFFLFLVCCLYIFGLTIGIPFYWLDYINIYKFSGAWNYNYIEYGFEFAFRPLENIIHIIFFHTFGITTIPFRILKVIMTGAVALFIYYFVNKNTENKLIAFLAGLFYLTSLTVLQSAMYIYDFEIVVQFFLLLAAFYFFKTYENTSWKTMLLSIIMIYLALLTKESAKVFVGVIGLFIIIHNWKKLKYFTFPLLILIFLAVKPGFLIGLESPTSQSLLKTMVEWFNIHNLFLFFKYMLISSFGVLITFFILYILYSHSTIKKQNFVQYIICLKQIVQQEKELFFFGLWFFIAALLTSIVPMEDIRYAIVPFLPFVIFSFICIGKLYNKHLFSSKSVRLFFILIISLTLLINMGMCLKYKYGFGSFFILLDESHTYVMEKYENSTFVYTDSISHYYNHFNMYEKNNMFTEYHLLNNLPSTENLFFFALQSPLQTKEKETAQLVKTFQKGPQCFMLYKQGNQTITSVNFSDNRYEFSEPTDLSYCSLELDTRFFIPSEITVTLIGDNENTTTIISPPIGKYKSCEYQCPVFANNDTKLQAIEATGSNVFLTRIYSGKVHYTR